MGWFFTSNRVFIVHIHKQNLDKNSFEMSPLVSVEIKIVESKFIEELIYKKLGFRYWWSLVRWYSFRQPVVSIMFVSATRLTFMIVSLPFLVYFIFWQTEKFSSENYLNKDEDAGHLCSSLTPSLPTFDLFDSRSFRPSFTTGLMWMIKH